MIKRFFDIIASLIGLIILFPIFMIIAIFVKISSDGPIFFKQDRVGLYGRTFSIVKFRTMRTDSDSSRIITVHKDERITKIGGFLRHYKLDELPQLYNVLKGDMSIVGPRPQMEKLIAHYPEDLKRIILNIRPGLTDIASLYFSNEHELLSKASDQEAFYFNRILPKKLKYKVFYAKNHNFFLDLKIILLTLRKIFLKGN